MSELQPSLGAYLKQVRLSKGWSLRKAATMIGIAHSRVDEVERMIEGRSNKPFMPSYITIVRFAKAYGLPVDELLRRAGHEPGIELDANEWALIKDYRALDPERRQRLAQALRQLRENGEVDSPST